MVDMGTSERKPSDDLFVNERQAHHHFELRAHYPATGQLMHIYFCRLDSVFRAFEVIPEEWKPCFLCLTDLAFRILREGVSDTGAG